MIKKVLSVILLLIGWCASLQAQDQGLPVSWTMPIENTNQAIVLPPIDFSDIRAQDSINDLDKSIPYRYGIEVPLQLDLKELGHYTELQDGAGVWRLAIESKDAVNLSFNFSKFFLPFGATMHLYNDERNDLSKSYTHRDNRQNETLGAWHVTGDMVWIELYQPANVSAEFRIEIGSVIHGYRMGDISQWADTNRGLNDSGACNYDVNCSVGNDFEVYKNTLKKSVALLNLGNGYLCSSVLLNNVEKDKTPYLLTANHCLDASDPSLWSARFNWVSPTPVCGTTDTSADLQSNFTVSGAILRAQNPKSDFALVELTNEIPDSWDVAFAGWDNTDQEPNYEVGIHHPNGDIMKICRDNTGAVKEIAQGTDVWLITGLSAGNGDGWEIGTTESGSSGSPLFNETGKVIGQLYAGDSFCDGTQNNDEYDVYGRFAVSWDHGDSADSRLKDWLDPFNSGVSGIETMTNILNVEENELVGILQVYPNPASIFVTVMNSKYPNLTFQMYDISGKLVNKGSLHNTNNTISVQHLKQGAYFLQLVDEDGGGSITKKIIVTH